MSDLPCTVRHLDDELTDCFCSASEEKRYNSKPNYGSIVSMLETAAAEWIKQRAYDMSVTALFDKEFVPCLVLLHGSVALGMGSMSGDMDAVLLVPSFIDREDYFISFTDFLGKCKEITSVVAITDTIVPLIRMLVGEVQVDLSLSVFGAPRIPHQINMDMHPNQLYRNMDSPSVHSLSGVVLAHEIRKILDKDQSYHALLRAVRAWVRARGVSGFIYGFPPTVSWTILVGYLCKRQCSSSDSVTCVCDLADCCTRSSSNSDRRQHSVTCLLYQFFSVFSSWEWPRPVLITPVQNVSVSTWSQKKKLPANTALMPIISPAFPNKNTAFSVREATKNIVVRELKRASAILRGILHSEVPMNTLFEKFDLCSSYRHFLLITFVARSTQELNVVGGLVNARMRDLAQLLDDLDHVQETRIHEVPKGCGRIDNPSSSFARQWLIGMAIEPGPQKPDGSRVPQQIDVTGCLRHFQSILDERDPDTDFYSQLSHEYLKRSQVKSFRL